jgi:NAD(P)-dependent dehydrogenase (short-subunit alcohol dehydrogenase family)
MPHCAELGGQVAVDIGAAMGIGRGIPVRLAREGMVVVPFLASTDASYFTGQAIYMNGGITAQFIPLSQPL